MEADPKIIATYAAYYQTRHYRHPADALRRAHHKFASDQRMMRAVRKDQLLAYLPVVAYLALHLIQKGI